jgi:hypothetical protein
MIKNSSLSILLIIIYDLMTFIMLFNVIISK